MIHTATTTRMESRLEAGEASVKQIPVIEDKLGELTSTVAKLAERMEEAFQVLLRGQQLAGQGTTGASSSNQEGASVLGHVGEAERLAEKIVAQDRQPRKLDLPTFDGSDPDAWVFRAERYFVVNKLTESEKLEAAGVCFEGEAQSWLRFEEREVVFSSWEELKKQLLLRFLGPDEGTLIQRFFAVKQMGTVAGYRSQFEMIAAAIGRMEEGYMTAVFINGLKEEIRAEASLLNPVGLKETINTAARIGSAISVSVSIHYSCILSFLTD